MRSADYPEGPRRMLTPSAIDSVRRVQDLLNKEAAQITLRCPEMSAAWTALATEVGREFLEPSLSIAGACVVVPDEPPANVVVLRPGVA